MNMQIIWLAVSFMVGFLAGRIRLVRPGTQLTTLMPTRTVRVPDLKNQTIYKAAASRLKRQGYVLFQTKDPQKDMKKLAKAANLSEAALAFRKDSSNSDIYKFYFSEEKA